VIVAQLVEYRREYGSWRGVLNARALSRAAACVGGLVIALPTLLSTLQLSSVMGRPQPGELIGNDGFAVPNLADVLLGGATLLGQTNAWTGTIGLAPAMATMLVALPMAALVDWRQAWHRPGVLTGLVVWAVAVLATQLPTQVSVFRYPVRYLVYVEVFLPLLVLIAVTVAPRLTRGRIGLAAGLAVAQAAVALFRAPVFVKWHLLAFVVELVALAAVVLLLRARAAADRAAVPAVPAGRAADDTQAIELPTERPAAGRPAGRPLPAVAGVVLVLAVATAFPIGEQMMVSLQDRANVIEEAPPTNGAPLRALDPGRDVGTTVEAFRAESYAPDQLLTVITWGFDGDRGWEDGVVNGSGNVIAGLRPGYASLAVWQAALNSHWCRTVWGATCSQPSQLLAEAGDTGQPWVDLMSSDTVLLSTGAPEELRDHFADTWTEVSADDTWLRYERDDDLPGRVTDADGVTVSPDDWTSGLARVGQPMDSYVVSTGDQGGTLALRIPWYPGMTASLDGRPLPVTTVEGAALAVELPAGVDRGRLDLAYQPTGAGAVVPVTLAGVGVIVLAGLAAAVARRRSTR
jgi:hypothetical protein